MRKITHADTSAVVRNRLVMRSRIKWKFQKVSLVQPLSAVSSAALGRHTGRRLSSSFGWNSISLKQSGLSWQIIFKPRGTFDPNSMALAYWNFFLLICIIFESLVIPVHIFFRYSTGICFEPTIRYLVLGADVLFIFDIFVKMHTGYYSSGNLVRNKALTRRYYILSRQFVIDLIALLPISHFLVQTPETAYLCGFAELNKLVRTRRIPAYMVAFDKIFARHYKFCKVVKVVLVSYCLCHYVACIYISFGISDESEGDVWKLRADMGNATMATQYVSCLYW